MLERIKCCLCHPRFIGKFFKDKASTIFLMVLLFFGVYVVSLGVKIYSSEFFEESNITSVASSIIQGKVSDITYDHTTGVLSGSSASFKGDGFNVEFFPVEDNKYIDYENLEYVSNITIVFLENDGYIELGGIKVSTFNYKDINVGSFNISDVQKNDTNAIYSLKVLIRAALVSSNVFFNTYAFGIEVISNILMYLVFVLISYFFSKGINNSIENNIRAKLCFYDNLIYFVVCLFMVLINAEWLSFIGVLLPLIYTNVTFRHIVRVQVKK